MTGLHPWGALAILALNMYAAVVAYGSPWAIGNAFIAGALAMGLVCEWVRGAR